MTRFCMGWKPDSWGFLSVKLALQRAKKWWAILKLRTRRNKLHANEMSLAFRLGPAALRGSSLQFADVCWLFELAKIPGSGKLLPRPAQYASILISTQIPCRPRKKEKTMLVEGTKSWKTVKCWTKSSSCSTTFEGTQGSSWADSRSKMPQHGERPLYSVLFQRHLWIFHIFTILFHHSFKDSKAEPLTSTCRDCQKNLNPSPWILYVVRESLNVNVFDCPFGWVSSVPGCGVNFLKGGDFQTLCKLGDFLPCRFFFTGC